MPTTRRTVLCLTVLALTLSSCARAVDVAPAPDSAAPGCAPMMVALPDELAGQRLRETTSQGTAAWGDPVAIVLTCGVPPPGPITDKCVAVNGVDWIVREGKDDANVYTVTTYGRNPATELRFSQATVASSTILVEMSSAVAKILQQQRRCLSPEDTELTPEPTTQKP